MTRIYSSGLKLGISINETDVNLGRPASAKCIELPDIYIPNKEFRPVSRFSAGEPGPYARVCRGGEYGLSCASHL